MIAEDYVSFEVAKLLKEKGFDEYTFSYYSNDGLIGFMEVETRVSVGYQRPTLQMAKKWLKEVHNIHIQAFRYPAKVKRNAESSEYSKPWFYQYTFLTELEDIDTDFYGEEDFETSEEAIESGIKYCLEKFV